MYGFAYKPVRLTL